MLKYHFSADKTLIPRVGLVVALLIWLGIFCGYYFFSRGLDPVPGPLGASLINWDAKWYLDIATHGYSYQAHSPIGQNIIFFPLYPLLLAIVGKILPFSLASLGIWLAAISGLLSIFLFHRFATLSLDERAADAATWAYALYPGAFFFASDYPTGLMNILALLALIAWQRGRKSQSAFWLGVGSASGPLMVFFAFALWMVLAWQRWRERQWGSLLGSILLGLFACSGLLAFIAYQYVIFHTPLAFIHGHASYLGELTPYQKLLNIIHLYPFYGADYVPLWQALAGQVTALNPARSVYFLMNAITLAANLLALLYFLWRREWAWAWIAMVLIGAYLWFQGASQGPVSTYRLLYLNLPVFLLAGRLLQWRHNWSYAALGAGAVALFLQSAFFVSGHWAF
ncbi:mannosyltransferase family protein [Acidithiobacillus sp. IBUN Pt1247-S3]|uniref:mannosyltransferase family protein n=1 Tax=Acidithiobacillus sp. IBUN Pt1247-S3 TaxID=3166642 RepID=UPI0034E5E059